MHLVLSDEMHANNMEEYETDSFLPIINESGPTAKEQIKSLHPMSGFYQLSRS